MLKKLNDIIEKQPLRLLIIYAICIRILLYIIYQGITIYPDSANYTDLANYLSNFSLKNYTGERTPGFPLLIALTSSLGVTVICQLILGVLSTYFIYDFSKINTQKNNVSFWVAVIFTSFIHVLFFEFAILTESLSLFLVVLSFWYISKFKLLEHNTVVWHYMVLSLIFSWLYFTRPMFIYFPLGFFLFHSAKHIREWPFFGKGLIVIIIPFICYFSWNSLNMKNIGYFTNTYYLGINLAQTATPFYEKIPDKDKGLRDLLIKHRDSISIHAPEKYAMSVWYAYDELIKADFMRPQDITYQLGRVSKDLFKAHPELYLKQVLKSWGLFWGEPALFWNREHFKSPLIKGGLTSLWIYIQSKLAILLNILFLIFAGKTLVLFFKGRCKNFSMDLFMVTIVLSGSLAQALVAYGSNSRFSFPFFAFIVYFVVSNLADLKSRYSSIKK